MDTFCDFCCSSDPRWQYPATDFKLVRLIDQVAMVADKDAPAVWKACDECAEAIEANDHVALALRTVRYAPPAMKGSDLMVSGFYEMLLLHRGERSAWP